MSNTYYELIWLFFAYSFLGWIGETVTASIKQKDFTNRGFASGPFCFIYGSTGVLLALVMNELQSSPVHLFIGSALLATLMEWITAKTLERLHRRKWWDYSHIKFNFDGYICLPYKC